MRNKVDYCGAAVLWLMFIGLAVSVIHHASWVGAIDTMMAQAMGAPSANNITLFNVIAFLGSPMVSLSLTFVLCVYLWFRRGPALSLWAAGMQYGGSTLVEVVKQIVARHRPVHELLPDTGYSFPSGHVFCTTILVLTLLMVFLPGIKDQEVGLVAVLMGVVWVGLVATSRLYLAQHFATDLAGSVLIAGALWLTLRPARTPVMAFVDDHLPARLQRSAH